MFDPRRSIRLLLAAVAASLSCFLLSAAETTDPAVSVADLSWIAGDWQGEKGGGLIEERWSGEGGGAMMGMFRWLADGKVRLYEFLLIEPGPRGPLMRIKHFSPGLTGWEEKEESLEFHLTGLMPGRAVFEMDPEIEETTLVYEQTDDGGLAVRLIKIKDGSEKVTEFRYSRR